MSLVNELFIKHLESLDKKARDDIENNIFPCYVQLNIDAGYSEKSAKTLARMDCINGYCKYEPDALVKRLVKKYSEYVENNPNP